MSGLEYPEVRSATFLRRVNRFIAHVSLGGDEMAVHVRNTGRLRELLQPGTEVLLAATPRPGRKTAYTLVTVVKDGRLINIDSLAPNRLALAAGELPVPGAVDLIRPEVRFGDSRFDIYFSGPQGQGFIEVKGVTLQRDGLAMFPDAPTGRGTRHLQELGAAVAAGYNCYCLFVIQMRGVHAFSPNEATDPAFAAALRAAAKAGVGILAYDCQVWPGRAGLGQPVPVLL